MKFSLSAWACYDPDSAYSNLPSDVIDISDDDYRKYWLRANESGKHLKKGTYPFEYEPDDNNQSTDTELKARIKRDATINRTSREINRLEDKSEDASAWRTYREQLRNVPEQDGFPFDITWPQQPADYTGK